MSGKLTELEETLKKYTDGKPAVIAFSGGVDSTTLAYVCKDAGIDVRLVMCDTLIMPDDALVKRAEKRASGTGYSLDLISIDVLSDPLIKSNDVQRCYRCKTLMCREFRRCAEKTGAAVIFDGTNADDLKQFRPGCKAMHENGVVSPFAICGLTKNDVRAVACSFGLEVSTEPSSPCMLTRFPYGTDMERSSIALVTKGEHILRSFGFRACRLRAYPGYYSIEIEKEKFTEFEKNKDDIIKALEDSGIYNAVLDEKGLRSGTMDGQ